MCGNLLSTHGELTTFHNEANHRPPKRWFGILERYPWRTSAALDVWSYTGRIVVSDGRFPRALRSDRGQPIVPAHSVFSVTGKEEWQPENGNLKLDPRITIIII